MGPDVIGIVSVLVAIVSVGGGLAALMLTGHRRLEGRLASEVAAVRGEIGGLRTGHRDRLGLTPHGLPASHPKLGPR